MSLLVMFTLLLGTALATSGLTGWLIFGPLSYKHVAERHPNANAGNSALSPRFITWLASGRFRALRDPRLNGLATPAQVLSWCLVIGLVMTGIALLPRVL
jgi:hypothetical protein